MYVRPVSSVSIKSMAKPSKAKSVFSAYQTEDTSNVIRTQEPIPPLVDHLLSMQFMPSLDGMEYGEKILDTLEKLRHDVLENRPTVGALRDLLQLLQTHKSTTSDPALSHVLEAIEVRAAVELAKREKGE